jgi:hypothetical protein
MRGRKTPEHLIDEIQELRKAYPAAEVVRRMAERGLPRRTTYRLLAKLKREDEERWRKDAERVRLALEREEQQRIRRARLRGAKRFTNVSQVPARVRKVRSL